MAAAKPLVLDSTGSLAQIAAADTVAPATLGTGAASATTFLRGDNTWATPTATATPAGSSGQIQYNNTGAAGGAANLAVDNGDLLITSNASPVAPAAGKLKLISRDIGARQFPSVMYSGGNITALQAALFANKIAAYTPVAGATSPTAGAGWIYGMALPTLVGTDTARAVATTNAFTRSIRSGTVSASTAGSLASRYWTVAPYTTGDGTGNGGVFAVFRVGFSDTAAVAGARSFAGFSSSVAAPTNVEPNTLINCIGIAQLSTDSTQLYIVYGGSAAQTAIALGTNFPPMLAAGAAGGQMYDLTLFAPNNLNGTIAYQVDRIGTAYSATGTITPATPGTQTPASNILLAPRF